MVSLKTVGQRFYSPFEVIEGGSGIVHGLLSETEQQSQPTYVFVNPRHVFRTPFPTALQAQMVLKAPSGEVYIVGENGPSERLEGTLWTSFRLFKATGQFKWERRVQVTDPITTLKRDALEPLDLGMIWCAFETLDREAIDREMRFSFEQRRVISGKELLAQDIVNNQAITKVDKQLGVYIGILT